MKSSKRPHAHSPQAVESRRDCLGYIECVPEFAGRKDVRGRRLGYLGLPFASGEWNRRFVLLDAKRCVLTYGVADWFYRVSASNLATLVLFYPKPFKPRRASENLRARLLGLMALRSAADLDRVRVLVVEVDRRRFTETEVFRSGTFEFDILDEWHRQKLRIPPRRVNRMVLNAEPRACVTCAHLAGCPAARERVRRVVWNLKVRRYHPEWISENLLMCDFVGVYVEAYRLLVADLEKAGLEIPR